MSTFVELFADFRDMVKVYVEELDVTELAFMRLITRAAQEFQRETEYLEAVADITRQQPPAIPFTCPSNMIRPVSIRGVMQTSGGTVLTEPFIPQSLTQFRRNTDKAIDGYLETPTDYMYRIPSLRGSTGRTIMVSIWQRELLTYPQFAGDIIRMWYIPDIPAFSRGAAQWTSWFPLETNFKNLFTTAQFQPELMMYEQAIVDYAVAMYIKSKGSKNYQVFENNFKQAVGRAIENKPTQFTQGASDYSFAPWA